MGVDASIVVVTYNSRSVIGRCLDSLRAQTEGVTYEVIVVDNASRDGSADLVESNYPWARVVRRPVNGGLSAANNDGVRASTGRHVLALNPDTYITHDAITPLVACLDANADAGVVAPKLLNDDGTVQLSCRAFPGYATAVFNRYSLLTRLLPGNRFSRDYLLTGFDHSSARDVDWVSGAALMMPRSLFDELGGWDAGFFMFNEDVDLCRRVHDAGRRVVYVPDAVVYHAIGVSESTSPSMVVARHRSMWRYYRKHLGGNRMLDVVTGLAIATRCGLMLAVNGGRRIIQRVRRTSVV